jgi:hypothetical protein
MAQKTWHKHTWQTPTRTTKVYLDNRSLLMVGKPEIVIGIK